MRNIGRLTAIAVALTAVMFVTPGPSCAAHASRLVGIQVGYFVPATEGWKDGYGKRGGVTTGLTAGYALNAQWAIGAEAAYFSANNQARNASGQPSIEKQELTLIPVTVGVEYRMEFSPEQVVVPFVGLGYRRVEYSLKVSSLSGIRGGAGGSVVRGGFDLLLDALDPLSASGMQKEYGVAHTYLRFEAQLANVSAPSEPDPTTLAPQPDIDLGGKTFLLGLRFEF